MKYSTLLILGFSLSLLSCSKSDNDDNDTGSHVFGQVMIDGVAKDITTFDCPTSANNTGDECGYGLAYEEDGSMWVLSVIADESCSDLHSGNYLFVNWTITLAKANDGNFNYHSEWNVDVDWTNTSVMFDQVELTNFNDPQDKVFVSSVGSISCER